MHSVSPLELSCTSLSFLPLLRWKWKLLAHPSFPCPPFPILAVFFHSFPPWSFSKCLFWRKGLRRNVATCHNTKQKKGDVGVWWRPSDTTPSARGDASSAAALGCCKALAIVYSCSLQLQWPVAYFWMKHVTTALSSNGCLLEITAFLTSPQMSWCLCDKSVLCHWSPLAVMLDTPKLSSLKFIILPVQLWFDTFLAGDAFHLAHFHNCSEISGPVHCMRGTHYGAGVGVFGFETWITLILMFWEEYECSQERNQILTFVTTDIQKINWRTFMGVLSLAKECLFTLLPTLFLSCPKTGSFLDYLLSYRLILSH